MKIYKLITLKQIFYGQVRHKLSFMYKKIVRFPKNSLFWANIYKKKPKKTKKQKKNKKTHWVWFFFLTRVFSNPAQVRWPRCSWPPSAAPPSPPSPSWAGSSPSYPPTRLLCRSSPGLIGKKAEISRGQFL